MELWPETGQSESDLEIRRRKFGWLGHTLRKGYDDFPSSALNWNTQGDSKRERPKTNWSRTVEKEYGKSWNFMKRDTQNIICWWSVLKGTS
jgi:hypothetical protein